MATPKMGIATHAFNSSFSMIKFSFILVHATHESTVFDFRGKEEVARVIWVRIVTLSKDFRTHNMVNKLVLPLSPIPKKWEKPLRGFVIGGGYGFKNEEMTGDWAKLYAFEESLKIARLLNITKVTFETDCAGLANRIKKHQ
ncbi:hypothetical protein Godav_001364 [Gossypium davidsonii]|uniref:RNase H type-1 domain-containing protein n=1 Tax=Gossypium davidsonii TaxID=34287 RepID=A0A7J8T2P7_GOSDV|nr:hypothetical protein [Gossypium davidsonii]